MEIIQQKENGENVIKCSELEKDCDSDPLIYQLVRVEGDGTLVPATEDEVMQFGHLLDDGKVEDLPSVEEISKVEPFLSARVLCTDKSDLKGFSQVDNAVKAEVTLKTTLEDTNNPNNADKNPPSLEVSAETTQNSTIVNNALASETEKTDATSTLSNMASNDNTPSVPDMITVDSKPNFSLLEKDEICLDGLSIRELQEVFLATFGRQTNVKDKSWLKRRIAMGLTHSYQVPTSNFIIKDKQIVPKEGGAQHEVTGQGFCEARSPQESTKKRTSSHPNFENNTSLEEDGSTSKRMRKPTKRYIEELSSLDRDESMRSTSSVGRNINDRMVRSRVRPNHEIGSWQAAFRTRNDSLGGFRVQVPFTSRARRCRPRKNLVALMAGGLHGEDGNIIEESEADEPIRKLRTFTQKKAQLKNIDDKRGKENQEVAVAEPSMVSEMELEEGQSEGEDAHDSNPDECSTKTIQRSGNMRRKHHRAWTLCEVLKLVEGVARYGAGRWSEIRRLSFSSYSYRTSVDLKDKWRNLLRASMAPPSEEKEGKHTRKPASLPIPTSILVRVRALAELHAQTGTEFPANKLTPQHGRKVVQGKGSGFL